MFIELHMIQNFAPSCLNRDDTNTPKDCVFGGVRRARISSQCVKRATRLHVKNEQTLEGNLGMRTKRLLSNLTEKLVAEGKDEETAVAVVTAALDSQQLTVKEDGKTQYLLFLGENEIEDLNRLISEQWDTLKTVLQPGKGEEKRTKKAKKKAVPAEITKAVKRIFKGCKAADIAMFGRMVADAPEINVDAACQVAHAISTHKVDMEMDFYTAVDDLKPEDTAGADMMGTIEFNSACFYRYAVIHWEKLVKNLHGDADLAKRAVEAFLRGSVEAIPTGKQNTFAAHNPPSFVLATVRDKGMRWSLANAFEKPVRAYNGGLVEQSIKVLDRYWGQLCSMYDGTPKMLAWTSVDEEMGNEKSENALKNLGARSKNIDAVITAVLEALS